MRSMLMRADGSLVHPRHEGGATRRTNGRGRVETGVLHAFPRQPVEVRGRDLAAPVATQRRPEILRDQPQNVRTRRSHEASTKQSHDYYQSANHTDAIIADLRAQGDGKKRPSQRYF